MVRCQIAESGVVPDGGISMQSGAQINQFGAASLDGVWFQ
jgi:hypothetical protein